MADRIWTEEQRAAIEARDHTLLVSAAAGSGKTAVLVQRILERLLDRENPCDVTDFLVVTFTRAAAGEMKEKMTRELDRELRLHPNDRRLQRQLALMPFAAFETMDGFFYRLVKEFAPELGVAGTARIASEAELSLLFESVRDEWTELCYQNAEEDFLSAVDYFSGSRDDRSFLQVAELLRQQTMALLRREEFLEQQLQLYQNPPPFGETPFGRELLTMAALRINAAHLALNEAVELSQNDEVLQEKYLPALLEFRERVARLEEKILQNDFSGAKALADDLLVPGFRPARGAQEDLKRQVTARRDLAKKQIEVLRERCFFLTEVQAGEDAVALSGALRGLIRYVQGLEGRFTEAKNERRILDFSDLTRLLFRLLLRREGDEFVPTERAKELSKRYKEILIDEYQDTNELQDRIFRAIARDERNLFFVGDAKQSIYLFRQAEPRIFVEKKRTFAPLSQRDAACRQVTLSKNFRSRSAVLDFVNAVFSQTMSEALGGLSYEGEELRFGASYRREEDPPVEIALLTREKREVEEEEPAPVSEAAYVARRVEQLLKTGVVTEQDGSSRPIRKKDIVILLRSAAAAAPRIERELTARGIPAFCDTTESFFARPEISLLLSLLSIIDNPLSDVPMAAVLRSPLVGLGPDELAAIRLTVEDGPFYYAAKAAEKKLPQLTSFFERLERWRELAAREPVERLLHVVLEETGFLALAAAMPMGELRCENIRLLLSYAAEFESAAYRGLFRFNRYIESLKRSGRDLTAARRLTQEADVVRIMSIHKSKGLEFPVVILCGLGSPHNTTDQRQRFVIQNEVGIGLKLRDTKRMVEFNTLQRAGVIARSERERLAEELRCLYVALTRPTERLLLVLDARGNRGGLSSVDPVLLKDGKAHPAQLLDAASLGEILLLALQSTSAGNPLCAWYGLPVPEQKTELACRFLAFDPERHREEEEESCQRGQEEELLREEPPAFTLPPALPDSPASALPTKLTVTRLKDLSRREEADDAPASARLAAYRQPQGDFRRPSFVKESRDATPAEAGTAMHELVQFAYLRGLAEDPCAELDYLVERGFLSEGQRRLISMEQIKAFTNSALFTEMLSADKLERELKFTLLTPAGELLPDLAPQAAAEQLLLQGVIDCVFEREDDVVLVDYKTDRVRSAEILVKRYRRQLQLYAQAYRRMTGRPVTRCVIWSFVLGREIEVS